MPKMTVGFIKNLFFPCFPGKRRRDKGLIDEFVSSEDEEEIIEIFEKKKWPSVLGSKGFVHRIKERFYSDKTDDEVPQSKELDPEVGQIQKVVEKFYGISKKELLSSRRGVFNEPRNMAIYLTRQLRGDTLKQIGLDFKIIKYSSVSSSIERTKKWIAADRKLRAKVNKLVFMLRKSQEQT